MSKNITFRHIVRGLLLPSRAAASTRTGHFVQPGAPEKSSARSARRLRYLHTGTCDKLVNDLPAAHCAPSWSEPMPTNGAAARLPLPLDLPSAPITAKAAPSASAKRAEQTEVEHRLAAAAAAAAFAVGRGLAVYAVDAQLNGEVRATAGDCLAQVAMLTLEHFGAIDFATARREARRILWANHGTALRASNLDAAAIERTLDVCLDAVFEIA